MKRFYLSKLSFLLSILLGWNMGVQAQTATFSYTGAGPQTYSVPSGVASVSVDVQGGKGGNANCTGVGGKGGRVQAVLNVTPGQILNIYVGGAGANYVSCCGTVYAGGFNGGGTGYQYGAGGGGASDIRIGGTALSNRVIVAGGGGASSYNWCNVIGGPGGGLTGGIGIPYSGAPTNYSGQGGNQATGGAGSTYSGTSQAGSLGQGGGITGGYGGGGGGGGYYGGGSGDNYTPGGGGSSYTDPTLASAVTHTQGFNNAAGVVTICPIPNVGTISGSANICPGTTTTLAASGVGGGIWTSASPLVSVNPSSGVVTGVGAGLATVTYSASNSCATGRTTFDVTINPLPAAITGPLNVCVGSTITLADADAGGTWSSSSTALATVNSSTGVVTAVSAGSPSIIYTLPTGCQRSKFISSNPVPVAYTVTGTGSYCSGDAGIPIGLSGSASGINYQLYNGATAIGASVPGNGSAISFGLQTTGATYTVKGTDAVSACQTTMTGTGVVTVNPLPPLNIVNGGGNYCAGGTGRLVGLNGSVSGVNYQLYRNAAAIGAPVAGTGSAFDFGSMTVAGIYSVSAAYAATGCTVPMTGTTTVGINPLPSIFTLSGGGNYCVGGAGVHILLSGSVSGVNYRLMNGATPGPLMAGTGSSLDFGLVTGAGNYTAIATDAVTGCSSNMSGTVTVAIAPLPVAYSVTGGGGYCTGGSGIHVGTAFSNSGINYQLMRSGSPVGSVAAGVDGPLDFGLQLTPGAYTVVATNATSGCTNNMTGGATISINSLPSPFVVTLPGAASYCAGGAGVHVALGGSVSGTNYQLYAAGSPVGSPVAGTGTILDFGAQTLAGIYTAMATNSTTGCTNNMSGSVSVSINPLPALQMVSTGGSYCAGGTGVDVTLGGSVIGTRYQLFKDGILTGSPMVGTGVMLDFGNKTAAGSYTIIATTTATGCVQAMTGSAPVSINPLPTVFAVTGGGGYCNGGSGSRIGLTFSNLGVNYQLMNGSLPVGGPAAGTGSTLDFGAQSATGNYTVVASNNVTGCTLNMAGSATVSVNPLPVAYSVSGGGNFCPGGSGVHVGLGASNPGIRYQLLNGTTPTGAALAGTGALLDFGLQTATGTYTVMAINNTTSCSNTMTGSAVVNMNPTPVVFTVTGGGSFCAGGTGVNVGTDNSEIGVNYQLYRGTTPVGGPVSGTGIGVNFGLQTVIGRYTAVATNATTGCVSNMSGSSVISIVPLPLVYTVMGGGAFCSGGSGVHVNLSGSTSGISYQLKNGGLPVGSAMTGTSGMIDFGAQTAAGSYTIEATNPVTGCMNTMAASATVVVNSAPGIDTVNGGGNYCAGGLGVLIGMNNSVLGARYQLYSAGSAIGIPVAGTGAAISFGLKSAAGVYTVVASDPSTCTSNMQGSATVVINPIVVPTIGMTQTPSGNVCAGTSVTYNTTVTGDGTAPVYAWSVGGVPAGTGTTYSYVPANGDIVSVSLTSNATCATPTTVFTSLTMTVNALQTPSVTVTSNPGAAICAGTPVLFSANPAYGGAGATYKWFKNGAAVWTGITYSDMPANNDRISARLYSNYGCRTIDTANSSDVIMNVTVPATPTVSIVSHPGTKIYIGQLDTLVATVTNAGTSPSYQWSINGDNVPAATSLTFVHRNFDNGDVVAFKVTNTNVCGVQTGTNSVTLEVINNLAVKQITSAGSDIKVMPNPSRGELTVKGTIGSTTVDEVSIEVTNMLGQIVYNGKAPVQGGNIDQHISLSNTVANGMYIMNIRSGAEQTVFHIVIEK